VGSHGPRIGRIEWHLEAQVDAPPDDVYGWLTDYQPDDHTRPAFCRGARAAPRGPGSGTREIVALGGNSLEIRDAWGRKRFTSRVTLDPGRRALSIDGDYGYKATWRAHGSGAGTRIEVTGSVDPGGVAGLFMGLAKAKRAFLREMEDDFRGHLEALREDPQGGAGRLRSP
jgi:hypothetical protein